MEGHYQRLATDSYSSHADDCISTAINESEGHPATGADGLRDTYVVVGYRAGLHKNNLASKTQHNNQYVGSAQVYDSRFV